MRAKLLGLIILCLSLVGCDHATKAWAESALRSEPPMRLMHGVLDLRYAQNDDVAFNLLRWIPADTRYFVIIAVTLFASLALVWLWRKSDTSTTSGRAAPQLAVVLMLAGALGNIIDRLFRGYVVDFIHLHRWPIFNVADVLIVAGMLLWAIQQWRPRQDTVAVK